ncbi:MAG: hypothetical protein JNM07_05375 [Phycisphaerae bacterium]|nr:hypothetical protein [Phycisphaerae bacterium]
MPLNPHNQPPRGPFAVPMLAATVLAIALAAGTSLALGGDARTSTLASLTLTLASAATLFPILASRFIAPSAWGVTVFAAGFVRMLLVIGVGFALDRTRELAREPFWIGLLAGALTVLIVETALAVLILSKLERSRVAAPNSTRPAQA